MAFAEKLRWTLRCMSKGKGKPTKKGKGKGKQDAKAKPPKCNEERKKKCRRSMGSCQWCKKGWCKLHPGRDRGW